MGIVLLGMFIPFLVLGIYALIASARIRRGTTKSLASYYVVGLLVVATIWISVSSFSAEGIMKWASEFLAVFLLTFTALCALIVFLPKSKVYKKYR